VKKKVIGVSIGVLLVAAAIPWYVGRIVEDRFVGRIEQLMGGTAGVLGVSLLRYDRGWFASEAVHRINPGGDPSASFEVHHRIDHLPRLREGWARVHSFPVWSAGGRDTARYYFGDSAPVTLESVVGFDGALDVTLHSPAFGKALEDEPDMRFTWGGAQGWLRVDREGKARMQLKVPGLALHGQGVVATFADLKLDGDWRGSADPAAWSGKTLLSVSAVGLSSPEGGARLRHVEAGLERRDEGETIAMSVRLRVGEGSALGEGGVPAQDGDEGFREAALDLHLDRLGKRALRTYVERMSQLPAVLPEEEHTRVNAGMALALLADLLEGEPELRIERARLTTPNGSFSAAGVLTVDPAQADPAGSDLLSRLRLHVRVDVSEKLLEGWLARDTYRGVEAALRERSGEVDEQLARELTGRFVRERIEGWTAAGILATDRDRYLVKIDLARGHLSVNGVPSDALLPAPRLDPAAGGEPDRAGPRSARATPSPDSGEMSPVHDRRP